MTTEDCPIGFEIVGIDDNPLHTHSFFEIFYVIDGSNDHILQRNDKIKRVERINMGDTFLLTPSEAHAFGKKSTANFMHRDIIIRKSFLKETCDFISPNLYEKICNYTFTAKAKLSLDHLRFFEKQIQIIIQTPPAMFQQRKMLIRSFLSSFLSVFLTHNIETYLNNYPAWFNGLLARFNQIEYMQAGVAKIAQSVNYDAKYLCCIFKKYMGVTMTEYLNETRLNHSLNLIQNTNSNISWIAQELGFSSVSYFNVIFKKKFGITPKELRNNYSIQRL